MAENVLLSDRLLRRDGHVDHVGGSLLRGCAGVNARGLHRAAQALDHRDQALDVVLENRVRGQ